MKTKNPEFKDIVAADMRRYGVSSETLAAEMGVSRSMMYEQLRNPITMRARGIIAIQKLTKLPYSEIMLLIQQAV